MEAQIGRKQVPARRLCPNCSTNYKLKRILPASSVVVSVTLPAHTGPQHKEEDEWDGNKMSKLNGSAQINQQCKAMAQEVNGSKRPKQVKNPSPHRVLERHTRGGTGACVCDVCVCVCVLCVCRRRRRRSPGIQNQKQEPRTKMWGKILSRFLLHLVLNFPHF